MGNGTTIISGPIEISISGLYLLERVPYRWNKNIARVSFIGYNTLDNCLVSAMIAGAITSVSDWRKIKASEAAIKQITITRSVSSIDKRGYINSQTHALSPQDFLADRIQIGNYWVPQHLVNKYKVCKELYH